MNEHIKAKDILGPVLYVQVEDEEGNDHWPEDMTTSATRVNESDVKYIRADLAPQPISVSEGLPGPWETVMVFDPHLPYPALARLGSAGEWWWGTRYITPLTSVTHWMAVSVDTWPLAPQKDVS